MGVCPLFGTFAALSVSGPLYFKDFLDASNGFLSCTNSFSKSGGVCFSHETSVLLLCVAYLKAERGTSFWNANWHSAGKCPTCEHEKGKLGLVEKKSM